MKTKHTAQLKRTALALSAGLLLTTGCSTARLDTARCSYASGQFDRSVQALTPLPKSTTDRLLFLMERGMASSATGNHRAAIRDWLEAASLAEKLNLYSLTGDTPSYIINDRVMPYRGAPYELVLLRTFTAESYLSLGEWSDAAVEARNIAQLLQNRNGFPDNPFSRYLAGLCLELTGDGEGASFQYRQISNLVHGITVSESGLITPATHPAGQLTTTPTPPRNPELVCFIGLGMMHDDSTQLPADINIYEGDRLLGQGYLFADVETLRAETSSKLALRRNTKALFRILLKELLIHELGEKDKVAAQSLAMLLRDLEVEDTRRWETLPRGLYIARVCCPRDLNSYRLVMRDASGNTFMEQLVGKPFQKRQNVSVSFTRCSKINS